MPEDNLVSLASRATRRRSPRTAREQPVAAITDLVMIYPEGRLGVLNSNPAAVVDAPWVTEEQSSARRASGSTTCATDDAAAKRSWTPGFRPAADRPDASTQSSSTMGTRRGAAGATIEPGRPRPGGPRADHRLVGSVKKPAIVTFVVDTSGSMAGQPIDDVRQGLKDVIDSMSRSDSPGHATKVGLVTFSTDVTTEFEPSALADSRFGLADAIDNMSADGAQPCTTPSRSGRRHRPRGR